MLPLSRLAIGAIQDDADEQAMIWGLWDVLDRQGLSVQAFLSQSRFPCCKAARVVTGQCCRHLDSWVMSPGVCQEVFLHSARSASVSIVQGKLSSSARMSDSGGRLDDLCRWLDLPRIAVVDVSRLDGCRIPACPPGIEGVLLDRVANDADAAWWRTTLGALWDAPVLGAMTDVQPLREKIQHVAASRMGSCQRPTRELCRALGDCLVDSLNVKSLLNIASRRKFDDARYPSPFTGMFRPRPSNLALNIAVAFDDAFQCYFPDALDLLEASGAKIRDFSPLHDEHLPADADVVCFGCGPVAEMAEPLAANHCLKQDLWRFAASGGRVYAEGGGAAYLCEHMLLSDGSAHAMTGLLPAVARRAQPLLPSRPVEVGIPPGAWLASTGSSLRGYSSPHWRLHPLGGASAFTGASKGQVDVMVRQNVFGSLVHWNLAAQPELLGGFFAPEPATAVSMS